MFEERFKITKPIIWLLLTNALTLLALLYVLLSPKNAELTIVQNKITVQIAGEVMNPNIYELEQGARLYNLIEIAGGFTELADMDAVNLAIILTDEMKITIPSKEDNNHSNKRININSADLTTLMTLDGIGEVKANAIISYREQHGPFKRIEDIMKVTGIGEKTYENIKDYICV